MGNKVCCQESRTKGGEMQEVEPEVVSRSKMQAQEDNNENVEDYETPETSKQVQQTVDRQKFFRNELSTESNPQKRRYGGDTYIGQLDSQGRGPNGFGRMYKQNGSLYIGYFDHGKAEGSGVFIFEDGSYYKGDFHKNNAESQNGYYANKQITYEGGFRDNKFDGKCIEKGSSHTFKGTYINGVRQHGTLRWQAENGQYEYNGPFNDRNQFHGRGTLVEPNGKYEGQFENGEKHGEGVYSAQNGTRYEGTYFNGYRDGSGTIFNGDGTVAYKGQIKKGFPHGKGSIFKNGKELNTTWVEGIDVNLLPNQEDE